MASTPWEFRSRPRWCSCVAIVAAVALAACTNSSDNTPDPQASEPQRGGTLEVGVLGEPATLDPYGEHASDLTYALVRPVFPTLYRFKPDGSVEPDLAADLEVTGRRARLTLRPTFWSDGHAVTARDVVASIERATPPSGFAAIDEARVVRPKVVELRGDIDDWHATLAAGAYVLPGGRLAAGRISGGPFRFRRYVQGRSITYEPNEEWDGEAPLLDEMKVSFVQSTQLLIRLLADGRLDAAAPPMSVNLDERLDEAGLLHDTALGWEGIALAFDKDQSRDEWLGAAHAVDSEPLLASFIRDDGRFSNSVHPEPCCREGYWEHVSNGPPPPPSTFSIVSPEGDELLGLMQRAIQLQLIRTGVETEIITGPLSTFYGSWADDPPGDARLIRTVGAPGATGPPNDLRSFIRPLAHIRTIVAWRDGVHGIAVNPTLDGPLWNAYRWWKEPPI